MSDLPRGPLHPPCAGSQKTKNMRQNTPTPTNNQPGLVKTPRFAPDGFDCRPPPSVIEEMLRQKSHQPPPPPSRVTPPPPVKPPHGWFKPLGAAIGYGLLVGLPIAGLLLLCSFASSWHSTPESTRVTAPVATPPVTAASVRTSPIIEVRRGELVSEPIVLRATLVEPTNWRLQVIHYALCDGQQILVTYRGEVPSFGDLPKNPNPNDMYKVAESGQEWVFYQLANFARIYVELILRYEKSSIRCSMVRGRSSLSADLNKCPRLPDDRRPLICAPGW